MSSSMNSLRRSLGIDDSDDADSSFQPSDAHQHQQQYHRLHAHAQARERGNDEEEDEEDVVDAAGGVDDDEEESDDFNNVSSEPADALENENDEEDDQQQPHVDEEEEDEDDHLEYRPQQRLHHSNSVGSAMTVAPFPQSHLPQPLFQPSSYRQLNEYRHSPRSHSRMLAAEQQQLQESRERERERLYETRYMQPAAQLLAQAQAQAQAQAAAAAASMGRYDLQPNAHNQRARLASAQVHAPHSLSHSRSASFALQQPTSAPASSPFSASSINSAAAAAAVAAAAGNVSPKGKAIDELLRCFICYGRTKEPHLCPSCSKIGCRACYLTWIEERGVHTCPACRQPLTRDQLVNCRFMNDMIAALQEVGVNISADGSDTPSKGSSVQSTMKPSQSHNASPGASACPIHPTQSLSYFCLTCSVPLCSDCAMFEASHRGHDFAKLDVIYQEHVSLIQIEIEGLRLKLKSMEEHTNAIEKNMEFLQRKKDEMSQEAMLILSAIESGLMSELKKKLLVLLAQKNELVKEGALLSSILAELDQQLDPAQLPKHQLIQKSNELIHHLYELHQKPLVQLNPPTSHTINQIHNAGAATSSSSSSSSSSSLPTTNSSSISDPATVHALSTPNLGVTFPDELVPEFYASSLVRVVNYKSLRRQAQEEEEYMKQLKAQHVAYDAQKEVREQLLREKADAQKSSVPVNSEETKPAGEVILADGGSVVPPAAALLPLPPPLPTTAPHELLYSSPMLLHGQSWRLKLYCNGNGIAKGNYLSVFVELTASMLQAQHAQPNEKEGEEIVIDNHHVEPSSTTGETPSPFLLGPSRGLPAYTPSGANKYEYRVEMLPHPRFFPLIQPYLSLELLESRDVRSPLNHMSVASYVEQLQYIHCMNAPLCAALASYQAKIVSRVFTSNFEKGESWGYNRFFRIDLLEEEGYLARDLRLLQQQQKLKSMKEEGKDDGVAEQQQPVTSANSSVDDPDSSIPAASVHDGDLLFKFYIRPPTYYLQQHEQRLWIHLLEEQVKKQAKELRAMKKQENSKQEVHSNPSSGGSASSISSSSSASSGNTTAAGSLKRNSASLPPVAGPSTTTAGARSTPPLRMTSLTSGASAATNGSGNSNNHLNASDIMHAMSAQPSSSILSSQQLLFQKRHAAAAAAAAASSSSSTSSLKTSPAISTVSTPVLTTTAFPSAAVAPAVEILHLHDDDDDSDHDRDHADETSIEERRGDGHARRLADSEDESNNAVGEGPTTIPSAPVSSTLILGGSSAHPYVSERQVVHGERSSETSDAEDAHEDRVTVGQQPLLSSFSRLAAVAAESRARLQAAARTLAEANTQSQSNASSSQSPTADTASEP